MKINHELPLYLLNKSYQINEYDFCLPLFYSKSEAYKNYFKQARIDERFCILDCGLFEGKVPTNTTLIKLINELKPNVFIVPDVWDSTQETLNNAKYWIKTLRSQINKETELMVVLQGHKVGDFVNLYLECEELGYKHFAFNHSSIAYQNIHKHPNPLVNQMNGRQWVISKMKYDGVISDNHYIHLLGASLPQEFLYYKDPYFTFIQSVDTSSPIINGAEGIIYEDYGLFTKPKTKMEEVFEKDLEGQIGKITFNINKFKDFVK